MSWSREQVRVYVRRGQGYERLTALVKDGMMTYTTIARSRTDYGKDFVCLKISGNPMGLKLKYCTFDLALNRSYFDL